MGQAQVVQALGYAIEKASRKRDGSDDLVNSYIRRVAMQSRE